MRVKVRAKVGSGGDPDTPGDTGPRQAGVSWVAAPHPYSLVCHALCTPRIHERVPGAPLFFHRFLRGVSRDLLPAFCPRFFGGRGCFLECVSGGGCWDPWMGGGGVWHLSWGVDEICLGRGVCGG